MARLDDIKRVMEADPKDLAAAEASYTLLLGDLAAMEAGKAHLAAHQARFNLKFRRAADEFAL